MKIHQWMISYTRQTEWVERRGILLWLALYVGGLGGGLYLVSLYFNSLLGMFLGWLIIVVLKGGFHLAFLGKPLRFWRIVLRPQTSWLARGFIFVVLFVGFGGLQLAFSYWLPGTAWEITFKVLAGIMALGIATYTGFVLNRFKAIPFWNSNLLPVLFILCGLLGGFGFVTIIAIYGSNINLTIAETGSRWLLITNALLIAIYLGRASYRGPTGKRAVIEQIRGSVAPAFWVGVVVLGIAIPFAIAFSSYFVGEASVTLLVTGVACELTGGLMLRYCILKAGAYQPLLAASQVTPLLKR